MLFCDRDVAPIFGHLSRYAGGSSETSSSSSPRPSPLALPGAAPAHATLSGSDAADAVAGSTLRRRAVVLRFDQAVTITPRAIEVFTADGHKVSGPAVSAPPTDGSSARRSPA